MQGQGKTATMTERSRKQTLVDDVTVVMRANVPLVVAGVGVNAMEVRADGLDGTQILSCQAQLNGR